MIKVVAKNFVREDKLPETLKLYEELVEASRQEAGCISYDLFQDEQDATILTMLETWESKEDLENHMKTEHFTRIVPQLRGWRTQPSEMNLYHQVL